MLGISLRLATRLARTIGLCWSHDCIAGSAAPEAGWLTSHACAMCEIKTSPLKASTTPQKALDRIWDRKNDHAAGIAFNSAVCILALIRA